jgi:hypothetical protein
LGGIGPKVRKGIATQNLNGERLASCQRAVSPKRLLLDHCRRKSSGIVIDDRMKPCWNVAHNEASVVR